MDSHLEAQYEDANGAPAGDEQNAEYGDGVELDCWECSNILLPQDRMTDSDGNLICDPCWRRENEE